MVLGEQAGTLYHCMPITTACGAFSSSAGQFHSSKCRLQRGLVGVLDSLIFIFLYGILYFLKLLYSVSCLFVGIVLLHKKNEGID